LTFVWANTQANYEMGWFKAYSISFVSALAGGSVAHHLLKPDLRLKITDERTELSVSKDNKTLKSS